MHPQSNKNDNWLKLRLCAPSELTDALANFLAESGAQGVFQENPVPPFTGRSEEQAPEAPPEFPAREVVQAYLPDDETAADRLSALRQYLQSLAELFPDLEPASLTTERVSDPGWGEEWKKYFKPFRVGRGIIIKPTWEPYAAGDGDTIIEIDPGMAFGTGQHASTLMCLESIEDILAATPAAGERVLDAGAGTGILAIAAAKLGAKSAVCIDIDEQAVTIARENAAANNVARHLDIRAGEIAAVRGPFSLIVANITAGPLIRMHDDFLSLLAPGGLLVMSGILEQDREAIERRFLAAPLAVQRLRREKEWLCYILKKDGGAS